MVPLGSGIISEIINATICALLLLLASQPRNEIFDRVTLAMLWRGHDAQLGATACDQVFIKPL